MFLVVGSQLTATCEPAKTFPLKTQKCAGQQQTRPRKYRHAHTTQDE